MFNFSSEYLKQYSKEEAKKYYIFHAARGLGFMALLGFISFVVLDAEKPFAMPMMGSMIYCITMAFNLVEVRSVPKPPVKDNKVNMQAFKYRMMCLIPGMLAFGTPILGMLPIAWATTKKFGYNMHNAEQPVADAPVEVATPPAPAPTPAAEPAPQPQPMQPMQQPVAPPVEPSAEQPARINLDAINDPDNR